MQPQPRPCPNCGQLQPQSAQTCAQCGAMLPPAHPSPPMPPAGYGAPPRPVMPGYGQASPPAPGVASPGYGPPPAPAPPAAYGAPMRPTPPPIKKNRAPLIIMLCAVAVVLVGGGLAAFLLLGGSDAPDTTQTDYDTLAATITAQQTPDAVAAYSDDLSDFVADHPSVQASDDLAELVGVCAQYAGSAWDNENRYTAAESALGRLANADDAAVADCAYTCLGVVRADYDEFIDYFTDPTPPDPGPPVTSSLPGSSSPPPGQTTPADPFDNPPYDMAEMDFADLYVEDDTLWYSFNFTNTGNKTIVEIEGRVFCYDAEGNPVYDEFGDNWDWCWDYDLDIAPGDTYGMYDYLSYLLPDQVTYIFPVILYTHYDDGSTWGMPSDADDTDTLYAVYDTVNAMIDEMVAERLG